MRIYLATLFLLLALVSPSQEVKKPQTPETFVSPRQETKVDGVYVDLLKKLIQCRPVSSDKAAVSRATEVLASFLKEKGIHCTIEDCLGYKILYASTVKGKKTDFLLNSHIDVVPAINESQYTPEIKGGVIYGRGTSDCMGCTVCLAQTLVRLKDSGKAVSCIFSGDEEIGGKTTAEMVARGYGEGAKFIAVVDADNYKIAVSQKGIVSMTVTAKGQTGHAAAPWRVKNCIDELINAYVKLRDAWPKPDLKGNLLEYNSMALCQFHAGATHNQIPDKASMTLNFRVTKDGDVEKTIELVKKITGMEVTILGTSEPVNCNQDDPALQNIKKEMEAFFKGREITWSHLSGATDARHFKKMGVPIAILGLAGKGAHSANERLPLASMQETADFFVMFAKKTF